jgi:hypothetical protein
LLVAALLVSASSVSAAAEYYAVIVTGAAGGSDYAEKYRGWREKLVGVLARFKYPGDHVIVLAEATGGGVLPPTQNNVRAAFAELQRRAKADDLVFVFLMGHGVGDGDDAKFNLVGPDLTVKEWAALVKAIRGRVVFVNGASSSFPFLAALSGPNRIVVTANAASAQQFETVFPGYFVEAFDGLAADADHNGKVSIWEAFAFAADRVNRWFEQRNQLPTERSLLDDNGDGLGREGRGEGADGALASATFLQPLAAITEPADSALGALLRRRAVLESSLEALRARKAAGGITDAEYDAQLEPLLVEIARIDREIRESKR